MHDATRSMAAEQLAVDVANIPAALRERQTWILWEYISRDGQKPTKLPKQANDAMASVSDPATWASYSEVMRVYRSRPGKWSGVGFVFAADDPFVGIDLDDCRDPATGEIKPWGREILDRLNSYSEISPSGCGVKVWVRGDLPVKTTGKKKPYRDGAIEMYHRGRYFAVTGRRLDEYPASVEERQDVVSQLWREMEPSNGHATVASRPAAYSTDIVGRARRYVAMMPAAISGQGGHSATYTVACRLVRDFALDDGDALQLLHEFNERCEPPWSDAELAHKIKSAIEATAGEVRGTLLAGERPAANGVDLTAFADGVRQPDDDPACGPVLTRLADIEPRDISWLWPGRVPLGRLTLLVGMPGAGKSFVTMDAAARVSTGTPWPDGAECLRGSVVLLSAEDDAADTIRPRLDAHYADVSRVHLLSAVRLPGKKKPRERTITLADVDAIEEALRRVGDARLVVIDPIGSYLGGGVDAHRDNEVRSVLAPIAAMAEKHGAAVVIVAHRRKTSGGLADDTALGSRGFTGIARAVWHVSKDPEEKNRRLLLPGKCNLSRQNTGLAFAIGGEPARIAWARGPVDMTADEGLAAEMAARERPRGRPPEALDGAEAWLRVALADGPRLAKELADEWTHGHGGSIGTLKRAKQALAVDAYRETIPGPWLWRLQGAQNYQEAPDTKEPAPLAPLAKNTAILPFFEGKNSKGRKSLEPAPLGRGDPESDAWLAMVNDAFAAAEDAEIWGDAW